MRKIIRRVLQQAAEWLGLSTPRQDSGVVNIAKVEITVSSNQAPGQIARDVAKELVQMRRFRGGTDGRNFS